MLCFGTSFQFLFLIKKKKVIRKHFPITSSLGRFNEFISGEWSNKKQATKFPALWSQIKVCYRPLNFEFLNGHSFYVESAYDYSLDQPYKSGVLLVEEKENYLELSNFKIIGPEDFWYGSYDVSLLEQLSIERLIQLPKECNTEFTYDLKKDIYVGKTKTGKKCIISGKNKKTFLDSTFVLQKNHYFSLDIGRDIENGEQIWGSTQGPFRFDKIREL